RSGAEHRGADPRTGRDVKWFTPARGAVPGERHGRHTHEQNAFVVEALGVWGMRESLSDADVRVGVWCVPRVAIGAGLGSGNGGASFSWNLVGRWFGPGGRCNSWGARWLSWRAGVCPHHQRLGAKEASPKATARRNEQPGRKVECVGAGL